MPKKDALIKSQEKDQKPVKDLEYLPGIYTGFTGQYPEISQALDNLAKICQKSGPLNKKTSELVKLGVAIGLNSEGSVRSHARRALEAGSSADEIRHAYLLSMTTAGYPHTMAAYKWIEEVLSKNR